MKTTVKIYKREAKHKYKFRHFWKSMIRSVTPVQEYVTDISSNQFQARIGLKKSSTYADMKTEFKAQNVDVMAMQNADHIYFITLE